LGIFDTQVISAAWMNSAKSLLRIIKNNNFSDIEVKVRQATSNDHDLAAPPLHLMREIARATHDATVYSELFGMLWKRLADVEQPLHVSKALMLLKYLVLYGSDRFIQDAQRRARDVAALTSYQHYNESNVDDAKDCRVRAKEIFALLTNASQLAEEREKISNLHRDSHHLSTLHNDVHEERKDDNHEDDEPRPKLPKARASSKLTAKASERVQREAQHAKQNESSFDIAIASEEELEDSPSRQLPREKIRRTIRQTRRVTRSENEDEPEVLVHQSSFSTTSHSKRTTTQPLASSLIPLDALFEDDIQPDLLTSLSHQNDFSIQPVLESQSASLSQQGRSSSKQRPSAAHQQSSESVDLLQERRRNSKIEISRDQRSALNSDLWNSELISRKREPAAEKKTMEELRSAQRPVISNYNPSGFSFHGQTQPPRKLSTKNIANEAFFK